MNSHVEVFCGITHSQAQHAAALEAIERALVQRQATISDVVAQLGPSLTSPNELLRARGTLLLASLLERLPPSAGYVDASQQSFLLAFLLDRARDTPCVSEVARGLLAMVALWPLIDKEVESILTCIFTEVFTQSHDQPTRHSLLRVMDTVLTKHASTAQLLNHDFVYGYLQMIDGERDPRNLLLIFGRLTPEVVRTLPGHERFVEDLFDVTSCYYPINFTPRPNDTLTAASLVAALDAAMCCTRAFAQFCLPFLLEKLGEKSSPATWASFEHALRAFEVGPDEFPLAMAKQVWALISTDVFAGTAEAEAVALQAFRSVTAALSIAYVSSSTGGGRSGAAPLDALLAQAVAECVPLLGAAHVGTKTFSASVRVLCAAASASVEASRAVAAATVAPLLAAAAVDARAVESVALLAAACNPKAVEPYAGSLLQLGLARGSATLLVALLKSRVLLHTPGDSDAMRALVEARDAAAMAAVAPLRGDLVVSVALPALHQSAGGSGDASVDARWYATLEAAARSSAEALAAAWLTVLHPRCRAGDGHAWHLLERCVDSLRASDAGAADTAAALLPGVLGCAQVTPTLVRGVVRVMTEAQQRDSLASLQAHPNVAVSAAALSSLHASAATATTLAPATVARLRSAALEGEQWAAVALANMANKGMLELDAASLAETSSTAALALHGWLGLGVICAGAAPAVVESVLQRLVACLDGEHAAAAAQALATALGPPDGPMLSVFASNARVRPFARQRAFAWLLPQLTARLSCLALVTRQMPAPVLLGELATLLPLMVRGISSPDSAVVGGSLEALCAMLPAAIDAVSVHTDTLLPRVASLCNAAAHFPVPVRMAALALLEQAARLLPFARVFPVQDAILAGVAMALDDPRRDVRRLAVRVSNVYHTLS